MNNKHCCDTCIYYHWYYDYCEKWNCATDAKEVHDCWERNPYPYSDIILLQQLFKKGDK